MSTMLKTKEMSKVQVVALKKDIKTIIETLHQLKLYHFSKPTTYSGRPLENAESISEQLNKLQTYFSILEITKKEQHERRAQLEQKKTARSIKKDAANQNTTSSGTANQQLQLLTKEEINQLHETALSIARELRRIEEEEKHVQQQRTTLQPFINSPIAALTPDELLNTKHIGVLIGTVKDPKKFKEKLQASSQQLGPHSVWIQESAVVLAYAKLEESQEEEFTTNQRTGNIPLTPALETKSPSQKTPSKEKQSSHQRKDQYTTQEKEKQLTKEKKTLLEEFQREITPLAITTLKESIAATVAKLNQHAAALNKEKKAVVAQKQALEKKVGAALQTQTHLLIALEKEQAPLYFAMTEEAFVIEGYVPSKDVGRMKTELDKKLGNRYYIREELITRHEDAPIAFSHPKTISPFSFFLELYALPKYKELDPTFFTFITFPLIFGAMLGDIGYGLTLFFIFSILKIKFPKAKNFFTILMWSAVWSIIFGIFFGEIFGAEEIFGYHLPYVIHRLHSIDQLLLFAIGIGILHINLGLLLGFKNEYEHHGLYHAITAKLSWIVLQVGVGAILLNLTQVLAIPLGIGIGITALAVLMIIQGEGIRGAVELPGIFGNILSYARIMAIGLASAGLAIVVNDFATAFFQKGLWGILPGILILLIGHGVNIILGILGPFLHSLRLHYVEQYTKFYEGGGKAYRPFGQREEE